MRRGCLTQGGQGGAGGVAPGHRGAGGLEGEGEGHSVCGHGRDGDWWL